jgi:RimJ/RimL family protein N-acetyltransferase
MMRPLDAGPLCLRPLAPGDEALYVALYGNADTMARIAPPQDAATSARSLGAALRMNQQSPRRGGWWVICRADGHGALGLAGLLFDAQGGAEVGVVLPAAHQGQGHATRAIAALADHAFGALGLVRLYTRHDAGHALAAGLMQALGFEQIGNNAGDKGWRWQLTPERWARWPRRQGGADPLPSAFLTGDGRHTDE